MKVGDAQRRDNLSSRSQYYWVWRNTPNSKPDAASLNQDLKHTRTDETRQIQNQMQPA